VGLIAQISPNGYSQDAALGLIAAWELKGAIACVGNPNYPAADKGHAYVVSSAGKIGGAAGTVVEVGDMILALEDNAGGTQAAVGASWTVLEHNVSGAEASIAATLAATPSDTVSTIVKRAADGSSALVVEHSTGGPRELDGTLDPSAGAGVAAPIGSTYTRRSAIAAGVLVGLVVDHFVKDTAADAGWLRTKRSPLVTAGQWALKYPAALRARTAAQAQDIVRAILANQAAVATPTEIFYADAANTRMTAAITADHLARTGAGVTFPASAAFADGAAVVDAHTALNLAIGDYLKAADNAKYKVAGGAFAVVLPAIRFTAVGTGVYWASNYKGDGQAKGWHIGIDANGKMNIGANDGVNSPLSGNGNFVYSDAVVRAFAFGRSVTAGKLWFTSNLGDVTVADTTGDISSGDGIFGFFTDLFGAQYSGGTFDMPVAWWLTGASAETIYTNRVALTASSRGLLDV
jgi:hypothetical protein